MWIFVICGAFFLSSILGQDECNFRRRIGIDPEPLWIKYPPYNVYHGGDICTWTAIADVEYKLQLHCDVQIAGGLMPICPMDYFAISPRGLADLSDGKKYCGTQSFLEESISNRMFLKLYSEEDSLGGVLNCTIRAVANPCSCGRRNNIARITGGEEAGVNEFPMMAALLPKVSERPNCGAVIISVYRALTVRHCIAGQSPDYYYLVVGEHDVTVKNETRYTKRYEIESYTCQNNDCSTTELYRNDLTLLKTKEQIILNRGVGLTCLPWHRFSSGPDEYANKVVEAAGWGWLSPLSDETDTLQKVTLVIIPQMQCVQKYGGMALDDKVCAIGTKPGQDTCSGDSGGSLFIQDHYGGDTRYYTIALVDFGIGCGRQDFPSVNTQIIPGLRWIAENTPESNYCIV